MMREFELYKLLVTEDNEYETALVEEIRWISDDELLVWVSYLWIREFIESMKSIFGDYIFDDGGFNGNFQESGVCINLEKMLDGYGLDLKSIFPPNKYSD